jgi:molybdopterin converting factor small subunit
MHILLQGQLSVAADFNHIQREVPEGTTVTQLILSIAQDLPREAKQLILKPDGTLRTSLFIALDNQHLRDTETIIPSDTSELILMPPMAGG